MSASQGECGHPELAGRIRILAPVAASHVTSDKFWNFLTFWMPGQYNEEGVFSAS